MPPHRKAVSRCATLKNLFMDTYIGDSKSIRRRLTSEHCRGNINGSALRRHVATALGYQLSRVRRDSGKLKWKVDTENPRLAEQIISQYIRSGVWKHVVCQNADEAKDFQYYAIQSVNPLLNIDHGHWDGAQFQRYQQLLTELLASDEVTFQNLNTLPRSPGVYLLKHDVAVHEFLPL
jgi:hypothetical protein